MTHIGAAKCSLLPHAHGREFCATLLPFPSESSFSYTRHSALCPTPSSSAQGSPLSDFRLSFASTKKDDRPRKMKTIRRYRYSAGWISLVAIGVAVAEALR